MQLFFLPKCMMVLYFTSESHALCSLAHTQEKKKAGKLLWALQMTGTLPSLFFSGDFQPKREKHSKRVPNWWPMRGPKRVSFTPATEQTRVFFQSSRKCNLGLWTCVLKGDAYDSSREADHRAPSVLGCTYGVWLDSSTAPALILPVAAKLLALSSVVEILEKSPPETVSVMTLCSFCGWSVYLS